jgi:hypothetical protein
MKIFLYLLLFSLLTSAQNIPFPEETFVMNDRFNNRQYAAFDSDNKLHIAYSGQFNTDNNSGEIFYAREEANGTFSFQQLTTNNVNDNYPTLSVDAGNKIHIGYTGRDNANLFQIKYIHNMGGTFSAPIDITMGGQNKATPFSKIGPDSVMHFVYYTFVSSFNDAVFYRSYDLRTSTLSPEVNLGFGEAGGDFEGALDIDQNGKVHIAVRTGTGLLSGPIKYFNNTTGTITEYPLGVSVNSNYPRIRIDNNNKVHIIYKASADNKLYYLNNVAGSFSAPVAFTPTAQLPANYQNFAVDAFNRLYFIYQSSQSASGRGWFLIMKDENGFSDTMRVGDMQAGYVTRNSSIVLARGNGELVMMYAAGISRAGTVYCDIFMKRGNIFTVVPVELASFSSVVNGNSVEFSWLTATETNNLGFNIERRRDTDWQTVAFVNGSGTSTATNSYSYTDSNLEPGVYLYRLTQVDLDGSLNLLKEVEVEIVPVPAEFSLLQNYPNPFNPSTTITFTLAGEGNVTLTVYDVMGREAASLLSGRMAQGKHSVMFDASTLSSGIYFYKLTAGGKSLTRKLMLIK